MLNSVLLETNPSQATRKQNFRYSLAGITNFYFLIYMFDSDFVWQMQLMILKVKNSCCVCRKFLTFN